MGRKKDERLTIPTAYICQKCGYASIMDEQPEWCAKCSNNHFDKLLIKANWKNREPFAVDSRQASPL